jgi:hypothetical protein
MGIHPIAEAMLRARGPQKAPYSAAVVIIFGLPVLHAYVVVV